MSLRSYSNTCHIKLEDFSNIPKLEEEAIFFEIINDNFMKKDNQNVIQVNDKISILNLKKGNNFNPYFEENEDYFSISWGCPLINNEIKQAELTNIIYKKDFDKLRKIDGQFIALLILKKSNKIILLSDRFNGINLFYAPLGGKLICSSSYYVLAKALKNQDKFEWSDKIIYDVIRMNRVFGPLTYDDKSNFLSPATLLEYDFKKLKANKYWIPSFKKKFYQSANKAGNLYIKKLSKSIFNLINSVKDKNIVLFLSGGHDSRSILSLVKREITCITTAYKRNSEVNIAEKCAILSKQKFLYCQLSNDHLAYYFDEAVKICAGFHSFVDAFFIGINRNIVNENQIAIHGHGLDYLFQGSYLPTKWFQLFGKPTFFKIPRLVNLPFPEDFINNVPYRVKGVNVDDYIKKEYRETIYRELVSRVDNIRKKYSSISSSEFDYWDMLLIDTLGRHYSRPNIESKNLLCHVRTPSFNNDLFDFFLSLPTSMRINALMPRILLSRSKLGKIPTGNWLFPAADSPLVKTSRLIIKFLKRRILRFSNLTGPTADDRTWPDLNIFLRQSLLLQEKIYDCFSDRNVREILKAIDWPEIEKLFEKTINGETDGAQFLFALASVSRFIQLIEEV